MNREIEKLTQQKLFWKYFIELTKIPRPSKHEAQVKDWIINYAMLWGYEHSSDSFGNLVVKVPASKDQDTPSQVVAIQSHIDMVCEKDAASTHDFFKDALSLEILEDCGTWLTAKGTTLGADNGIAVAYQMAIMDPLATVTHGPLEMIFTLDEETGLNGAGALAKDMVSAEYMINIDNFVEGVCAVGCAGGEDMIAEMPLQRVDIAPDNYQSCCIVVKGLAGGHSGADIYDGRCNALKLMEMVISELVADAKVDIYVISIDGGEKTNAIVREAVCACYVKKDDMGTMDTLLYTMRNNIKDALVHVDEGFELYVENNCTNAHTGLEKDINPIQPQDLLLVLQLMRQCPYGVYMKNKTETTGSKMSNNFSRMRTREATIQFVCNYRFANEYFYHVIQRNLVSVFQHPHITVTFDNYYDAWEPKQDSQLVTLFMNSYELLSGKSAEQCTLHVGIECGVINARMAQDIDAICIGPNIEGAHSPSERINVQSAEQVWCVLLHMLERAFF